MSPLENGKRPDLIKLNSDAIYRACIPLVAASNTDACIRSIRLPTINTGHQNLDELSLFVVTSPVNG